MYLKDECVGHSNSIIWLKMTIFIEFRAYRENDKFFIILARKPEYTTSASISHDHGIGSLLFNT